LIIQRSGNTCNLKDMIIVYGISPDSDAVLLS